VTELAAARGVTADAIAVGAALTRPWTSVVLSGPVTPAHLAANLAALTVGPVTDLGLAETPAVYWTDNVARPWA
jgi:aryl-alcohol dehydrogenase-like predicted oxidoreductase